MNNSYLQLLGLAKRASLLALGDEAARTAISLSSAKLLLISADASERTKETFAYLAENAEVLYIEISESREELGNALGKRPLSVVAICDVGMAAAVAKKLAEVNETARENLPALLLRAEKSVARRKKSAAKKKATKK